jgi:hypothetical protein
MLCCEGCLVSCLYHELTLYDLLSLLCCFLSNNSGYAGAASCIILSNWGSAYGTWKAGTFPLAMSSFKMLRYSTNCCVAGSDGLVVANDLLQNRSFFSLLAIYIRTRCVPNGH